MATSKPPIFMIASPIEELYPFSVHELLYTENKKRQHFPVIYEFIYAVFSGKGF